MSTRTLGVLLALVIAFVAGPSTASSAPVASTGSLDAARFVPVRVAPAAARFAPAHHAPAARFVPVYYAPAAAPYRWPLDGTPTVVRRFEPPPGRWLPGHRGVDLAAAPGATVYAAG